MKQTIQIGSKLVGANQPIFIIAEVGLNHNGSLQIARQLIKHAAECGADAVKFQKRNLKTLYQEDIINKPLLGHRGIQYLMPLFKDFEFSYDDYRQILSFCEEFHIQFLCTPFDKGSVDFLEKLKVPAYKIGSPDLTNLDLIDYICSKNKPVIISTGMSTWKEIETTVSLLKKRRADFILLHCNSNYPAPFHSINLKLIPRLKESFNCLVGYSGHEYGISVSQAAVALGACVIERHFTLDRTMIGPDHAASLEPVGLKTLIRDIHQIEEALGTDLKVINRGEFLNRETLGKSLVATQKIKKGTIINRNMITTKSPGTGISPQLIDALIGKIAQREIGKDQQFNQVDIDKQKQRKYHFSFKHTWGVMVRYPDFGEFMKTFNPPCVEFHLTDNDLKSTWLPQVKSNRELIVHTPEYCDHDLFDLCTHDIRIRKKSIDLLHKVIVKTKKLAPYFNKTKIPKIVIHPGGMLQWIQNDGIDRQATNEMYLNLSKSLKPFQDDNQVELLLENMPPFPWYFGGQWKHSVFMDANEISSFCKEQNINLCLDISHAALYCNFAKTSLRDYIKTLIPLTKHLHIADASNGVDGEGLQIGEGGIDFKSFKSDLLNYSGTFTVEIWQGHKDGGIGFTMALEKLQQLHIL